MYPKESVTYVPGDEAATGRGSWAIRFWHSLDLTTQFLLVATLIIGGSMAILGEWLSSQIAANQLRSRAESGALYMEGFLAGHIEEGPDGPRVSAERQQQLDRLLIGTDLATRVEGFRIWERDGTVLYSTDKSLMGKRLPSKDIEQAFAGQVVAQLETGHDDNEDGGQPEQRPLIEIYGPIYRSNVHEVMAVGELYEEAGEFIAQRDRVQRRTWAIVGATTVAIMGLLFLIVRRASRLIRRQSVTLKSQLASAQALAEQNRQLRKTADQARMDASKSNEALLNRIGSDLHERADTVARPADPQAGDAGPEDAWRPGRCRRPLERDASRHLATSPGGPGVDGVAGALDGSGTSGARKHVLGGRTSRCRRAARACDRVHRKGPLQGTSEEHRSPAENLSLPRGSGRAQQCFSSRSRPRSTCYRHRERRGHHNRNQRRWTGFLTNFDDRSAP